MKKYLLPLILLNAIFVVAALKHKNKAVAEPPLPPPAVPVRPVEPAGPPAPPPKKKAVEPEFTPYPAQGQWEKGTDFYADVLNHCKRQPKKYGDRNTDCHENCHGVEADIRNKVVVDSGFKRNVEGYYVGQNRAVIVDIPKFKILDVTNTVPSAFRGSRYRLYMTQQPTSQPILNDNPIYIWGEWNCYINGAVTSVEDAEAGVKQNKSDSVLGALEFVPYSLSVAMVCEKKDPEFFKANDQFKNFLVWNIHRAVAVYKKGVKFEQHRWDSEIPDALMKGDAGKEYREFMTNKLGMDLKELFAD